MKKLLLATTLLFTGSQMAMAKSGNVSGNPLMLASGSFNLGVEFKVADGITVGPTGSYVSYTSGTISATGFGFGVSSTIYFSGSALSDSWVFNPLIEYLSASFNDDSVSGIGVTANFGYAWFWPSGFNIIFGFGIAYLSMDFTEIYLAISGVLPSMIFSLGYAF